MKLCSFAINLCLLLATIVPATAANNEELKLFLHTKGMSDFFGLGECETFMDTSDSDDPDYCEGTFINTEATVTSSFGWRGRSVILDASRDIEGLMAIKTTKAVAVTATVEVTGQVGSRTIAFGETSGTLSEEEPGVYQLELTLDVPPKLNGKRLTTLTVSVVYSGTWIGGHVSLDDPASHISIPIS